MLYFPAFAVFQPLEEEILERVKGRLSSKAIINGLVIFVRFEPEFVGVVKGQQAEDQEDDDKSEGGLDHIFFTESLVIARRALFPTKQSPSPFVIPPRDGDCFAAKERRLAMTGEVVLGKKPIIQIFPFRILTID